MLGSPVYTVSLSVTAEKLGESARADTANVGRYSRFGDTIKGTVADTHKRHHFESFLP